MDPNPGVTAGPKIDAMETKEMHAHVDTAPAPAAVARPDAVDEEFPDPDEDDLDDLDGEARRLSCTPPRD